MDSRLTCTQKATKCDVDGYLLTVPIVQGTPRQVRDLAEPVVREQLKSVLHQSPTLWLQEWQYDVDHEVTASTRHRQR